MYTTLQFIGLTILSLGWPVTFAYLIIQASHHYHSLIGWIGIIIFSIIEASVWPVYWLILHWIPNL